MVPSWLDELTLQPGPPWHAMGTRSLGDEPWLLADAERPAELARKRELLRDHRSVVSARTPWPTTVAAEAEAAEVVTGRRIVGGAPLEVAASQVQEDLCVVVHRAGRWRLEAGVVCFPSMWRIAEKVGLPLSEVHSRVPAYATELADRVDRFLDRFPAGRPVWRRNWFVHDSGELHQPDPPAEHSGGRVPDDYWLRSERQTLQRLPISGAVLFTIRTQQVPLAAVAERPLVASAMASSIRSWSDELAEYRGAVPWRSGVLRWLEEAAG